MPRTPSMLPPLALGLALALLPAAAWADDITVTGCIQAGVEPGCLVLNAAGTNYNVSAALPKPTVGAAGKVTGTISSDLSYCQQGTILSPATWTPVDGTTCPPATAK